jgi:hypothetical protein
MQGRPTGCALGILVASVWIAQLVDALDSYRLDRDGIVPRETWHLLGFQLPWKQHAIARRRVRRAPRALGTHARDQVGIKHSRKTTATTTNQAVSRPDNVVTDAR